VDDLEQAIEHAPCEGAVGAATLQRKVNRKFVASLAGQWGFLPRRERSPLSPPPGDGVERSAGW
jgi:hypothetical protein